MAVSQHSAPGDVALANQFVNRSGLVESRLASTPNAVHVNENSSEISPQRRETIPPPDNLKSRVIASTLPDASGPETVLFRIRRSQNLPQSMPMVSFNVTQNSLLPGATIVASFRTARSLRRVLAQSDISIEHDCTHEDDELMVSATIYELLTVFLRNADEQNRPDRLTW